MEICRNKMRQAIASTSAIDRLHGHGKFEITEPRQKGAVDCCASAIVFLGNSRRAVCESPEHFGGIGFDLREEIKNRNRVASPGHRLNRIEAWQVLLFETPGRGVFDNLELLDPEHFLKD